MTNPMYNRFFLRLSFHPLPRVLLIRWFVASCIGLVVRNPSGFFPPIVQEEDPAPLQEIIE